MTSFSKRISYHNRHKYIFCVCMMFFLQFSEIIYSQHQTINDYSGDWQNDSSWIDMVAPGERVTKDVYVYGELFVNICISFNQCSLEVFDTLIVNGSIEFKNTSSLYIHDGAVLIVYGDYISKNKVNVVNEGTLVVAGRFEMQGADNKGSFNNLGDVYLFDTVPLIKQSDAYNSLRCMQKQDTSVNCGYKTSNELQNNSIFDYFNGLPYSVDNVSIEGNNCTNHVLETDKVELCMNDLVTFTLDYIGIIDSSVITWDFGEGAVPPTGNGVGPFEVYYTISGKKEVAVCDNGNIEDTAKIQLVVLDKSDTIYNSPCYLLEIVGNKTDLCQEEFLKLGVNTVNILNLDSLYWEFGSNAIPEKGYGAGPHYVTYASPGNKSIRLFQGEDVNYYDEYSVFVYKNSDVVNGKPCIDIDIIADKDEVCEGEVITVFLSSIGVASPELLIWDFGEGSVPEYSQGDKCYYVYYNSSGDKTIKVQYTKNQDVSRSIAIRVNNTPGPPVFTDAGSESIYTYVVDTVCTNSTSTLTVSATSQKFRWIIPMLRIDTVSGGELLVNWNVPSNEYRINVSGVTNKGCAGETHDGIIIVNECIDKKDIGEVAYAFTPNNDGYNDKWYITDIEYYPEARISVYDKFGRQVFYCGGHYNNNWDGTYNGKLLPLDSYFYIIDLSAYNKNIKKGIVTILYD